VLPALTLTTSELLLAASIFASILASGAVILIRVGQLMTEVRALRVEVGQHAQHWRDFQQNWGGLPSGIRNAGELSRVLEHLDHEVKDIRADVAQLRSLIIERTGG
jgi:hypothetical protein